MGFVPKGVENQNLGSTRSRLRFGGNFLTICHIGENLAAAAPQHEPGRGGPSMRKSNRNDLGIPEPEPAVDHMGVRPDVCPKFGAVIEGVYKDAG